MGRLALAAVVALALSGGCCASGVGLNRVRRATLAWEREDDEARYEHREPPPRPLYALPGAKAYKVALFSAYGLSGLLLLAGGGAAAAAALVAPAAPRPGEGVVCRRNPTFECLLLVLVPVGALLTVGGLASRNPGPALPGAALLLLVGGALLVLHAGTAQAADAEGITLGFGRRFRWVDVVGVDHVTEVQRTSSGATRTVGSYHRVRCARGSFKLRRHRYANWDEVWAFVEPRLRRPAS